jgi:hypothetical protein
MNKNAGALESGRSGRGTGLVVCGPVDIYPARLGHKQVCGLR